MKLSIITATFNSQDSIERCLDSVVDSNIYNYEHIIIDGVSTDKTINIIKKYQKINPNIKLTSEPDNGIYDALNKGVRKSTGDIIGFLHSDDFFQTKSILSEMITRAEKENLDGIYGDLNYVNGDIPPKIIRRWRSNDFNLSLLKNGWMPPHPTLFLKKEVYEKYGLFNLNYKISADYDFMLRILKAGNLRVQYLPKVVTSMQLGGASNKNLKNILMKMKEDLKILKNNNIGSLLSLFLKNIRKIRQFF
jgi:glycosyltransferase involved in cell wall biosynthesis